MCNCQRKMVLTGHHTKLFVQILALLFTITVATIRAMAFVPTLLIQKALKIRKYSDYGAIFYEGTVSHTRRAPVYHSFQYKVRMAVVNLDSPPKWWSSLPNDHLAPWEARTMARTDGPVHLLSHPTTAGYMQNPISVYYCYNSENKLQKCIAEVTNTPWAERVTFLFNPQGETVPKALHVSPLMDMTAEWRLHATSPGERLFLSVKCSHPELGDTFFSATFDAKKSEEPHVPNEAARVGRALQYGLQPHRVAVWIYWHALILLYKGVKFYGPPDKKYEDRVQSIARNEQIEPGRRFIWRRCGWPWNL